MKLSYQPFVAAALLLAPTVGPFAAAAPLPREKPGPLASDTKDPPTAAGAEGLRTNAVSAPASGVPYGSIINKCTVPGTVALTFDDGPWAYTSALLDRLRRNNVKATFFVNGKNWGDINRPDLQALVKRAYNDGHQIGSHTQTHADLAKLDRAGIVNQMDTLAATLKKIIGVAPVYMRPPYLSTSALALRTLGELKYHVINCDIDTKDYENDSQAKIQTAINNFKAGLARGGSIELSHDTHTWTEKSLAQAMIDEVKRTGKRAVTVGECLGDPKANWYRT